MYTENRMSLFRQLSSRQLSPCSRFTGSLWPVLECLQCHYNDEVVIYGGMTQAPVPIFACKFTPDGLHGNLLATGDEEGSVRLMDTRRPASQSLIKEIEAHRNAVFDVAWVPGGTKLLSGSGDGTVRLWDVVGGVMLNEFKAHSGSVKSIDVKMDEPSMFVSGSRDGKILVWDTRCAKRGSTHRPVNSISGAHKKPEVVKKRQKGLPNKKNGDSKHSVTSVLFHGNRTIASCGTADGLIKLWDLRRTYTNSRLEPPPSFFTFEPLTEAGRQYSFTSLVSGPYQSNLFASCTDDMCYMYNSTGLNKMPVRVFSGHRNSSFYVKSCVSPDGRYLLSGSSCGNAFLWQIDHPDVPPLLLSGHTSEVTAVSWCPTDPSKIVTCSDDNDLKIWRVMRGERSPGEVTGTCQSYSGKEYLRGMENLRKHLEDLSTRTTQSRSALQPLQLQSTIGSSPLTTGQTGSTGKTGPTVTSGAMSSKVSQSVVHVCPLGNDKLGHRKSETSSSSTKIRSEGSSKLMEGTCADNSMSIDTETPQTERNTALPKIHPPPPLESQKSSNNGQDRMEMTSNYSEKDIIHTVQTDSTSVAHTSYAEDLEPPAKVTVVRSTEISNVAVNGVHPDGKGSSPQDVAVTPERCVPGYSSSSSTKRKLDLSDENKPKAKRKRTMERESSGSRKKSKVVRTESSAVSSVESLSQKESGQRTMQHYFRPS